MTPARLVPWSAPRRPRSGSRPGGEPALVVLVALAFAVPVGALDVALATALR